MSDRDKLNSIRDLVLETREYFTDGIAEEILDIIKGE